MATPLFICGAECGGGATGNTSLGGIASHLMALPTGGSITATVPGSRSARAFRMNVSGAVGGRFGHTLAASIASPATMVARFAVYFDTLPNASCSLFGQGNQNFGVGYDISDGKIKCHTASGSAFAAVGLDGPVASADQWYVIDFSLERNGGTTYKLTVDGTDYGSVGTGGISAAISIINWGVNFDMGSGQTGTADVYFDDIMVSGTNADYPLNGYNRVAALVPDGDGTHSTNSTGDFQKGTGTGVGSSDTDTWQSLAQPPLPSTVQTNFLRGVANATSEYLEHTLSDLPGSATGVMAASLVFSHHSASATSNNHTIKLTNGSSTTVDMVNATVNSSGTTLRTNSPLPRTTDATGAAWDVTKANAARLRFQPQDVNPDAYLDGYLLEVAYTEVTADPKSDSDTGSGSDAGESITTSTTNDDPGSGADAGESIAVTTSADDPATGSDAGESIIVSVTDGDTATSAEAEVVGIPVSDSDSGASSDSGNPIVIDSSSNATSTSSPLSWSHTIGGGVDRLLVVRVGTEGPSGSRSQVTGVTYNGVALTQVTGAAAGSTGETSSINSDIWYMLDASLPAAGTYTISVTVNNSPSVCLGGATSVTGASQSAPSAVANNTSNVDVSPSGSVTNNISAPQSGWVFDVLAEGGGTPDNTVVVDPGQTQTGNVTAGGNGGATAGFSYKQATSAGSYGMTWAATGTLTAWPRWAHSLAAWSPASYAESITAAVTDDDPGAGVDAGESVSASLTDSDTATSADNVGSIALNHDDTGSGADAEALSASLSDPDTGTGSDAGESITAALTDTETGSGADAGESLAVNITDTDGGTSAEAESLAVALVDDDPATAVDAGEDIVPSGGGGDTPSDGDTATSDDAGESITATMSADDPATGADAESITAATTNDDPATGTDAGESLAVTLTNGDTGAGADAGEAIALSHDDTGSGSEAESISAALSNGDTGAGSESELTIALTHDDTGSGSDDGTIAASGADADTGAGADDAQSIALSTDDTGTGTDTEVTLSVTLSDNDPATGAEAETILVTLTDDDTATAVDAGTVGGGDTPTDTETTTGADGGESVTASLTNDDPATAAEAEAVAVTLTDADTATAADDGLVSASTSNSDTGTSADDGAIVASVTNPDTGTATDAGEALVVFITDGDGATAVEAESLSVSLTDQDLATFLESEAIFATLTDVEAATATDAVESLIFDSDTHDNDTVGVSDRHSALLTLSDRLTGTVVVGDRRTGELTVTDRLVP